MRLSVFFNSVADRHLFLGSLLALRDWSVFRLVDNKNVKPFGAVLLHFGGFPSIFSWLLRLLRVLRLLRLLRLLSTTYYKEVPTHRVHASLVCSTQQSQQSGRNGQKLVGNHQNVHEMHRTVSHFFDKKGLDSNSGRQGVSALRCSKNIHKS